jgi:betaine-aldehyde dehydrogenase
MTSTSDTDVISVDDRGVFVDGAWVEATGAEFLPVVNPATEETVVEVRSASVGDMATAVAAARAAFDHGPWPQWSGERRAAALEALADGLEARTAELSYLTTVEMGMPTTFSTYSQRGMLGNFRYYAHQARHFEFRTDRVRASGGVSRILRHPVGVVAAIAPWNGPLGVAALKLGPALASGCTVILKPAPETPLATYLLADVVGGLVRDGIMPKGVVNVLAAGREVSESLVAHPGVDKISFTGSTVAGRRIMAVAAERIARVTLELGGKSAAIIADDIPFAEVVPSLVPGGCGNTGQMCFALTRVLVSRRREQEALDAIAEAMGALVVGDPTDPRTTVGPLAMSRQRDRVEGYLTLAKDEGARAVLGGGRPAGLVRGYYIEPTLLAGVSNSMRIAQEEIFGPVICVIPYEDIDDAIAIANDSIYGLSGSVYTRDVEAGFAVAQQIRTGTCSVNGAVFDTTVPFGGYKQSGVGREGGPEGMAQFLEYQSVHMPD